MAEPFMPNPDEPDTALDDHPDAPEPEPHGVPAEADDTPIGAGGSDEDALPRFPATD